MHELLETVSVALLAISLIAVYLYRRSNLEDRMLWEAGWVAHPHPGVINVRYTHPNLPGSYDYLEALERMKNKKAQKYLAPYEEYKLGQWANGDLNYEGREVS